MRLLRLDQILVPAEATATATEIRVLGPVTIARVELGWLVGSGDVSVRAHSALERAAATGNSAIQAELSRYLQWAGAAPPPVEGAPEPWASGLRGAWREAAGRWASRGERYEQALELSSGDDAAAISEGHDLLRTLGAVATPDALARARNSPC